MHEGKRTYCPGLEFYNTPDMGLCGVENDKDGNQSTYQYLTAREAVDWMDSWINGDAWLRESLYDGERAHA